MCFMFAVIQFVVRTWIQTDSPFFSLQVLVTGQELRRLGHCLCEWLAQQTVLPRKDKPTVTDSLRVKEGCVLSHLGRSPAKVGGRREASGQAERGVVKLLPGTFLETQKPVLNTERRGGPRSLFQQWPSREGHRIPNSPIYKGLSACPKRNHDWSNFHFGPQMCQLFPCSGTLHMLYPLPTVHVCQTFGSKDQNKCDFHRLLFPAHSTRPHLW